MPRQETDLNPVSHITIDAIGKPGQRVFYIQAIQGDTPTTFIVEKIQVQTWSSGSCNSWKKSAANTRI